jgi:excisionase family DNA binding protein
MKETALARVPKLLLTPEDAALQLSISRTRVYDLIRRGDLASVRIGRVRRIPVAALQAYVERLQLE